MERLRGPAEVQMFGDGDEVAHLAQVQVHGLPLSPAAMPSGYGEGHEVVLHARNTARAADARAAAPGAIAALEGDLSSIEQVRSVARQANDSGLFDAVIHNAGVGYREPRKIVTADGLSHVFAINVLAPYLLTALITPPARLVYLSSGMHRSGDPDLADLQWARRPWNPAQAYSDSKLFVRPGATRTPPSPIPTSRTACSQRAPN